MPPMWALVIGFMVNFSSISLPNFLKNFRPYGYANSAINAISVLALPFTYA
jgi:predicted permease